MGIGFIQTHDIGVLMKSTDREFVARRAELMAELFLGDFNPKFIANANDLAKLDYFVGFENSLGSLNIVAVEVKSVEEPIRSYKLKSKEYQRLSNANLPVLLLVIDVKHNGYYYALFNSAINGKVKSGDVQVDLIPIDEHAKQQLREQLVGDTLVAA